MLWVVPHFNKNFEYNRIRTSFVLARIDQLDATSNRVAILGNRYIQKCLLDPSADVMGLAVQFQEVNYEMDLRAAEITAMMPSSSGRASVEALQSSLSKISLGYDCPSREQLEDHASDFTDFKGAVLDLSAKLASSAGL